MIHSLEGKVAAVQDQGIVLEVSHIGFFVRVPERVCKSVRVGSVARLFCYLNTEPLDLYGFSDVADQELFKRLITISGIGPRGALKVLHKSTAREIWDLILHGDGAALGAACGVGPKVATKIIQECGGDASEKGEGDGGFEIFHDAMKELGFARKDIIKAFTQVRGESEALEDRLKKALSLFRKK